MNVKRRQLDFYRLYRALWNHFPPGCYGFSDYQRVYVQTPHEMHVPLNCFFYLKGCIWETVEVEWLPHVQTMRVSLRRARSAAELNAPHTWSAVLSM